MTIAAPRTLLIAYDIAPDQQARPALIEAIMTLGEAWARPLGTVWLLRTNRSADEIEGCLAPLVGDHDGLVVQETRGEAFLVNAGVRWFRPRHKATAGTLQTEAAKRHTVAEVHTFPGNAGRRLDQAA
ncbi:MAG: hypothetical protein R3D67_02380 [Hyphomicrobiaceae bacterium]